MQFKDPSRSFMKSLMWSKKADSFKEEAENKEEGGVEAYFAIMQQINYYSKIFTSSQFASGSNP